MSRLTANTIYFIYIYIYCFLYYIFEYTTFYILFRAFCIIRYFLFNYDILVERRNEMLIISIIQHLPLFNIIFKYEIYVIDNSFLYATHNTKKK